MYEHYTVWLLPYGGQCHFLHAAPQRARTCINFGSTEGCRYGDTCVAGTAAQPASAAETMARTKLQQVANQRVWTADYS